ncbi:MAG: MFS transporter [Pseudomonadota bacterium]
MKPGSWASIGLIYLYGVLGVASLSKFIPLRSDLEQALQMGPQAFALLVALLMLPPALLASVGGRLIDRAGARRTLLFSALVGLLANIGYALAASAAQYQVVRIVEGIGLIGVFTAAPALIMATTTGARRVRAMAFWATYTPVGFSLGLAIAGLFAATPHWRGGFLLHGALFLVAAFLGLLLPSVAPSTVAAGPRGAAAKLLDLFSAYRQIGPLRLACAFGLIVSVGFGTNTVFPAYFAAAHQWPIGAASTLLATANLAMIAGSLLAGAALARGVAVRTLFGALAATGVVAHCLVFLPGMASTLHAAALCLWLAVLGGGTATVLSQLPRVIADPSQGAAAAGLLSQISALTTFITPPLWLAVSGSGHWQAYTGLALLCWLGSLLLLPVRAAPASRLAPAQAAAAEHPSN